MENRSTDFMKQRLSLYFDKALSEEEENQLLNETQKDPQLNYLFNKENTARQFIKTCVKRHSASINLKENILKKLR